MKENIFIEEHISKDPYVKKITDDKIINVTGESGSGKSTYTNKYLNDDNYIVIDTDEIWGRRETNNKNCIEFGEYLKNKYGEDGPSKAEDFDILYKEILDYYKDTDKTLVIDSAQYRNLSNRGGVQLIKGEMIIIRTSIDLCYERCLSRWKDTHKGYSEEEYNKYATRKKAVYEWYKLLNTFVDDVDKM